jgi:hypothetical protein
MRRNSGDMSLARFQRKITNTTFLRYMHVAQGMADCLGLRGDWLERVGTRGGGDAVMHLLDFDNSVPAPAPVELAQPVVLSPVENHSHKTIQLDLTDAPMPTVQTSFRRLFRCPLTLRDQSGREWPVIYDATLSGKQYHRRLSEGWRDFCRDQGVRVGDVVEFRRCPPPDESALRVRIMKRRRS